jgi:molybdate transport system regulatory protein
MAGKTSARTPVLKPRFRVVCGKDIAIGPGKMDLLAAVAETESLSKAARRLGMSYMRAWTLVNTMNEHFCEPVIIAERGGKGGGGMKVTETGRQALVLYQKMEATALKSTEASWRSLQQLLRT